MSCAAPSRIVLAFDTATDQLACAVARVSPGAAAPVEVLARGDRPCRRRANVELVPACLALLEEAGLAMDDVDCVVVGRGPGSFTGVRIGIAAAKGMGCGLDRPVYGASTLDAVAWRAWAAGVRGLVGVVGDAMRREVYPALYGVDDAGCHRLFSVETVAKAPEAAAAWADRADARDIQLTGDGLRKYRDLFAEKGLVSVLPEELWAPTGASLLDAAAADAKLWDGPGHPALVLPVYTRLSDAEENELKRLGMAEPATVATTGVDDALAGRHLQLRPMGVNDLSQVALLEDAVYTEDKHIKKLSLLPQGLTMAKEFFHRIPLSIREKTLEYGEYVLKMADLERSIVCRIERNGIGEPCFLTVCFLNEINGGELMSLRIYAPDYEQAKLMRERFYEKPSDIVTKIMNMFIKDSYL